MSLLVVEDQSDENCLLDVAQLSNGNVDENVDAEHGRLLVLLLGEFNTFLEISQWFWFEVDAADEVFGERFAGQLL